MSCYESLLKEAAVQTSDSLSECLLKLSHIKYGYLIQLEKDIFRGLISEKSIRTVCLNGISLNTTVRDAGIMEPYYLFEQEASKRTDYVQQNGLPFIPILNAEGKISDIYNPDSDSVSFPIRELTADDIPFIEKFFEEMGGESRAFFNCNDWNRKFIIKCLNAVPKRKTEIFFAAVKPDGQIAGIVFAIDLDTGVPAVGIAVHEKLKGKHLGRLLLEYMDEFAVSHGYTGLYLTTAIANMRGQGLYSRMGYRKMGTHSSGEFLYLKRFPMKLE